jgi:biopolymer transport protein ExbD
MSEVPGGETDAKPNLTPMLDMVFQLVTFFMLVINFKSAALDLSLKLPVVGSARPVDTQPGQDLLMLNIDKEGKLNVYGKPVPVEDYIAREAQVSKLAAKQKNPDLDVEKDGLPTTVIIRGDKTTKFHGLYHVIKICQDNGFRQFALKAMSKEE